MQTFSLHRLIFCLAIKKEEDFYNIIGNFLDDFYRASESDKKAMIDIEPIACQLADYQNAFVAAMVHKLANDYKLKVPSWVFKNKYYLKGNPWFDCNAKGNLRKLFMYKSPIEFKHRNIFVDENVLMRV